MSELIESGSVEIESVMQQVMKNAAKRDPSDYDFLPDGEIRKKMGDVQHDINIDRRWEIIYDTPIKSHRKVTGKLIIFMKEKTKKFFKWYVDRLFDQQVEFNHTMWLSYYQLQNEVKELRSDVERLKKEKNG